MAFAGRRWEARSHQKPAGENAHTLAARPLRASSIAIHPPSEFPAR